MSHTIKYSRYPNNEVRVTHYYTAVKQSVNPAIETGSEVFSCPDTASNPARVDASAALDSLDISSDFAQSDVQKMRKRTKFGTNAKRTILRLGGAYDTIDSEPSHYVFLTGTIPGGTHDAFMGVAEQSSYIVHSISQWLKRTCPTEHWFYVWELQGRGALHIHYCLHSPNPCTRDKILREWWSKWHSVIQAVGDRTNADMWRRKDGSYHKEGHTVLQAYAQEVRKSVAAYMAGYCGGSKDKHSSDANSPYFPSRWWGCSRASTNLLRGLTEEVSVEYSSYTRARREMNLAKEAISHSTDLVHAYNHKVGIGSTIVSYHPEDKGTSIWQTLTMTTHNPATFPNASSWIRSIHTLLVAYPLYIRALRKPSLSELAPLLRDLEDSISLDSLTRYSLHQRHLRMMHKCVSVLSLSTLERYNQETTLSTFVPPIWLHSQIAHLLKWNPHGWLSLESDFDVRLTSCWSFCDSSTTNPKGLDAVSIEAGISITEKAASPYQQLSCLSSD